MGPPILLPPINLREIDDLTNGCVFLQNSDGNNCATFSIKKKQHKNKIQLFSLNNNRIRASQFPFKKLLMRTGTWISECTRSTSQFSASFHFFMHFFSLLRNYHEENSEFVTQYPVCLSECEVSCADAWNSTGQVMTSNVSLLIANGSYSVMMCYRFSRPFCLFSLPKEWYKGRFNCKTHLFLKRR